MKLKIIIVVSALSASAITSNITITSSAAASMLDLVQPPSIVTKVNATNLSKVPQLFGAFLAEIGKGVKYFNVDIRQETYLRLLKRHAEKGWDDIDNMESYAYKVAKNIQYDQIETLNKHHEIEKELSYILAYSDEIGYDNFRDAVYIALENHPEILQVVNLHLFDGFLLKEVAITLNRPPNTVYKQWEKGVQLLRDTAERLGYKKLGSLIPELNANQFRNVA
jgi:DNA-directed RNA polymerase specialized sigma24 family protein